MQRIGWLGACLLAACASTSEPAAAPQPAPAAVKTEALPAPTQEGVATRIGADRNGQSVQVAVGERFAVELVGVPTAGYLWAAAATPDFLQASGEGGGPTNAAQRQPGFAGGNHWEVSYFTVLRAGSGVLRFEQRRPWETGQPPADTFSVTIVAR